uniref:(northern house mosquito) hypothetical protein n=1 Tax=Culex pipiens TaxID=7175 RepID=A0A8D8JXY7_CULPI
MKISVACLAALALLSSKVCSNEVEVAGDRATPTVDHLLQIVQLKLDELFVESSEQVEQLLTELYHLRQSVEHVAWLTNRVERAVQKVQLDNDVLVRNVSLLTSQTE